MVQNSISKKKKTVKSVYNKILSLDKLKSLGPVTEASEYSYRF